MNTFIWNGTNASHQGRYRRLSAMAGILILGVATPTFASDCDPVEVVKLLADDAGVSDRFGFSVSISGDTAIVGAYGDTPNGFSSGSAYILTNIGGVWTQQAKLVPDDGALDDWFGYSVSIDGDTAVIGARLDEDNGPWSGSAYIFTNSGGTWTQQAKILADDGAPGDEFGSTVSISGDTVAIGASRDGPSNSWRGAVYVFTASGGMWTQQAKIEPTDAAVGKEFGNAVAIDGDMIIAGAYADDDEGIGSGAAYIFLRNNGVWTQQAKLFPSDSPRPFSQFGYSVSISGDSAIVGARYKDEATGIRSGAAYVYRSNGGVWNQETKLLPVDGMAENEFGFSVSIDGDFAIVGSPRNAENGENAGAAYLFTRDGNVWPHQTKILPSDAFAFDAFAQSVAIHESMALVGAHLNEDDGFQSGSAYVFDLDDCHGCPADMNGDGQLGFPDVSAFIAAFQANDPSADFNGDGQLGFPDVSAFIAAFQAGCP